VRATRDLVTKVRVEFERDYVLEIFFREATSQYAYTLLQGNRRLLGWDNAPHHLHLPNAPHHHHREDGQVESAPLIGRPAADIHHIAATVNEFLKHAIGPC
jgi:hypothetical protein